MFSTPQSLSDVLLFSHGDNIFIISISWNCCFLRHSDRRVSFLDIIVVVAIAYLGLYTSDDKLQLNGTRVVVVYIHGLLGKQSWTIYFGWSTAWVLLIVWYHSSASIGDWFLDWVRLPHCCVVYTSSGDFYFHHIVIIFILLRFVDLEILLWKVLW